MSTRPSPTVNSMDLEVGKKRTGNDGNKWVVSLDKNGRHIWKKDRNLHYNKIQRTLSRNTATKTKTKTKTKTNENKTRSSGNDGVRKSPEKSATIYKEGTKRIGLDGNKWIIAVSSNGVKRWKLYKKLI